ncbi:MAG: hypothetical protein ACE5I4_00130 [Thermoplasmata archaeon]
MTEAKGTATGFAPFSREEMDLASKDQLIRWSKEYSLDESGMKYELRLRLLEYIRRQGLLLKGEEPLEEESAPSAEGEAPAGDPAPPPESASGGGETAQVVMEVRAKSAPSESPGVCSNCGGELSYIAEYERWYCYNCDTYAGSPAGGEVASETSLAASHRKAKERSGAGLGVALALAGLLTFLAHQILFVAPGLFPIPVVITVAPEVLFALPLVAFVLLGVGVMAGLRGLAHRA